jgi:hypothetical protein
MSASFFICSGTGRERLGHRLARQAVEDGRDLRQVHDVIDVHVLDRADRHAGEQRLVGVLHDGGAALLLDRQQPGRAVVEHAREHYANHAPPVVDGGRSEHWVQRRAVPVLLRPADDAYHAVFEQQVVVGRRDEDAPRFDPVPVARVLGRQVAGAREDLRQEARRRRRRVDRHEYGRGQVGGQSGNQLDQRLDAPGAAADHDNVMRGHRPTRSFLVRRARNIARNMQCRRCGRTGQ